jgi:hypothetical protein
MELGPRHSTAPVGEIVEAVEDIVGDIVEGIAVHIAVEVVVAVVVAVVLVQGCSMDLLLLLLDSVPLDSSFEDVVVTAGDRRRK